MANLLQVEADTPPRPATGRDALIEAAKRLLPERAPSTITGRQLAAEAGVNYGLVHHHFGGKDAALIAGLRALREDFASTHGDAANLSLLTTSDPYLEALIRSNIDRPDSLSMGDDFPIGAGLVDAVAQRAVERQRNTDEDDARIDAKARAFALVAIQLCSAVFGPTLLQATGVRPDEREDVQRAIASLYDELALLGSAHAPFDQPTRDTTPPQETT